MLSIEAISKTYPVPGRVQRLFMRGASRQPVPALRDVSFDVHPGEVVGLVGPNGAGKTTLLKTVCTLLRPDGGHVTVNGHDTVDDPIEVQQRLGVALSDDRAVYWRLTGRQNLRFFGVMYGMSFAEAERQTDRALEAVGLADRDRMTLAYSSGMKARLAIARALLHDPPVLVLDEISRSLDPVATEQVGELLRARAARGAAILLSSHRLDEVAKVCDRVVVLADGTVKFCGSPSELAADDDFERSIVELLRDEPSAADWDM